MNKFVSSAPAMITKDSRYMPEVSNGFVFFVFKSNEVNMSHSLCGSLRGDCRGRERRLFQRTEEWEFMKANKVRKYKIK